MRARRVLGTALAAVAVLVVVAVGLVWWLMSTEAGSRRVVAFLLGKSPEGLEVAEIRGALGRQLHLKGIRYRSGALSAEIDEAMLDIRPSALVRGRLMLEQVRVTGMRVVVPDSVPRDTAGTGHARRESPRPPIPIQIGEGTVRGFELDAPGEVTVRDGDISIVGNLDRYRFDISGTVFIPQVDTTRIHLGGTGSLASIRLDSTSTAEMLGGQVIPVGTVTWYPTATWDLAVAVDSIEPARLDALTALPGYVSLQATTAGAIDSSGLNGNAKLDCIVGFLRGRAVSGTATVRFRPLVLEHVTADVRWGPARIRGEGFVGDTLAITYQVDVRDVRNFMRTGSGRIQLDGNASGARANPRVQADIQGSALRLPGFSARDVVGRADVTLSPRGSIDIELRADSAALASQSFSQVAMSAQGTVDQHRIGLDARSPRDTVAVRLAGGVASRAWRGRIDSLNVLSSVDRWRLAAPASLLVSAALTRLDTLCVTGDSVVTGGCLQAEWRGPANWNVTAHIDSARLDRLPLASPVTGELSGRIEARNTAAGLDAKLVVTLADSGRQAGQLEGTVTMAGYRLGAPLARQPFEGQVQARFEDANQLAPLIGVDSLRAIMSADLHGSGRASAPHIEGEVRADSAILFRGKRTISGSAMLEPRVSIGLDRTIEGEIRLVSRDVQGGKFHSDSVVATLVSGLEGMRLAGGITVRNEANDSVAAVRTDLFLPGYHVLRMPPGSQALEVTIEAAAPDLAVMAPLVPGVDSLRGAGHLDLQASGQIGLPNVKGTLRVTDAIARLATGTEARGGMTGDVDLTVTPDRVMRGHVRVVPEDVRLAAAPGDTLSEVRVRGGVLEVNAGDEGVLATLSGTLSTDADSVVARFEGRASLPDYRRVGPTLRNQRLEAALKGQVDDFGFLPAFVAVLDSASGRMTFDASLSGTVGDARMAGEADVQDVTLRFPGAGITVQAINLTARGDDRGNIAVHGTARSGSGRLEIDGTTPARPTGEKPGLLTVRGEDFLAANSDEVRAIITPDLTVTLAADTIAIRGQVDVPHARIQLTDMPETAVRPSDDVKVIDEDRGDRERPIIANVRVALGEDVTFSGFHFDADLAGALTLLDLPDRPTRATGTLVIEQGTYRSYGQDLTVANGEVRFNGPLDNPGLSIRAERVVNDSVTVGISMAGSLKEPDVRLYSNLAMSQTQTLSYIVTGGPVGGSGASGNLVNKALSALGIGGSSQVINALGQDIGLSTARIQTEGDLQDASLVVGKFLSPKVYISYGVGLFDPVSTLRLRYILSSKLTLLAETGRETSADAVVRVKK